MREQTFGRAVVSVCILSGFVLFFFASGVSEQLFLIKQIPKETPDFSRYIHSNTLALPHQHESHRIIVVGDVHAQFDYLQDLLAHLRYEPSSSDVLIHVGDIVAKGSISDSLRVLDWMSSRNITGVRGNHDQAVIDWKSWQDWVKSSKEGKRWLDALESRWEENNQESESPLDPRTWVETQKKKSEKRNNSWWKRVPKHWRLFNEHYLIASAMKPEHHEYLLSLPLILHLPSYHTFIVHAGLLPSDPNLPATSPEQPLAHLPDSRTVETEDRSTTRREQEIALLKEIPQNNNPWVLLNMRGLLRDNTVTRRPRKGKAWYLSWNQMMDRCSGFNYLMESSEGTIGAKARLNCMPSNVIYGHCASRGVDIHRWSFGLDSGCVYGRKMTALVLESASGHHIDIPGAHEIGDEDKNDSYPRKRSIRFGDSGERLPKAYLVDVKCR